ATRQQEHTKIVAALEARAKVLEARLQAAETRVDAAKVDATEEESKAGHEITLALDPPRERGTARPADRQAAAPQWESAPAARIDVRESTPTETTVRIDVRESAPIAAPKSKRPSQFSEVPLFGSRR